MNCNRCGSQLDSNMEYCASCDAQNSQNVVKSKASYTLLIILSICILLTVMFIPMFDVWGGLFPDGVEVTFGDVVSNLFYGTDFGMWAEIFSWSAFVPAVVLLISALAKGKVMSILASLSGSGLLIFNLLRFISQCEAESVFDFDDCSVSIGFWIALLLFIICFFYSIRIKKKDERHISKLEKFIRTANPNHPGLTTALLLAGEAYMKGLYYAPVNVERALDYYGKAAERGDMRAYYSLAGYYLFDAKCEDDTDRELNPGIGLMYLVKAHLGGFQPATDMINSMIADGLIKDATCVEDLVNMMNN